MKQRYFQEGYYHLRSGLVIYPAQQKLFDQTLAELTRQLPAHFLLLADVTGQVILAKGEQNRIELTPLGSLVAGDLAASQEIARLTGQYQDDQMVLREGQKMHSFIVEAGQHLVLFVQVAHETPLGWARLLIQKAARQLAKIVAAPPPSNLSPGSPALDVFEAQLDLAQEEIPKLFSDALDELWQE